MSLVLRSVEVRGPSHVQLSAALGDPAGLVRIDCNDLAVHCRIQYRIYDARKVHAAVIYSRPDVDDPSFDIVRRMIDAALQDRVPGQPIEVEEYYDFGDHTEFNERMLPATEGGSWSLMSFAVQRRRRERVIS